MPKCKKNIKLSKKQKGILMELTAQSHFVKDPDNMIFTPWGGLGFIDLVVLNKKTGVIKLYDVKFASKRESVYRYKKERNRIMGRVGDLIGRKLKPLQKKLGVQIIYFDEKGTCYDRKTAKAYTAKD